MSTVESLWLIHGFDITKRNVKIYATYTLIKWVLLTGVTLRVTETTDTRRPGGRGDKLVLLETDIRLRSEETHHNLETGEGKGIETTY